MPVVAETALWVFFSGVTAGCIYAFVALGYVVVYSMTKIFNLAAGSFAILGALLAITFYYELSLPLFLAIILALIANCAIAAIAWRCFLHQPYSTAASHWSLLLIVAVFGLVLTGITFLVFGPEAKGLPDFTDFKPIVLGVTIVPQSLWIWGTLLLAVGGLFLVLDRTLVGKAFRACSEQTLAAKLMGINPNFMAGLSFVLAALLAGIGGVVMAPLTTVSYTGGLGMSVKGALAAMLGGSDKAQGAISGGLALGLAESFAGAFISNTFGEAIALSCLIVILLLRPEGFFGIREEKFCRK